MSVTYKHKSGRIWFQRQKFQSYELLQPYGMTDISDPRGAVNAIREPSSSKRGESVIVDVMRGEPDLPAFSIDTRLRKTYNFLLGQNCAWRFQLHLGQCDRPDNYFTSQIALHWEDAYREGATLDRGALIEGDNPPIGVAVPYKAGSPFLLYDFKTEFLSARSIAETEAITDKYFFGEECFEDCNNQEDIGSTGYAVTKALSGSPANIANVWYTTTKGQSWLGTSAFPFGGGEDISCVVAMGVVNSHRVIVARGTADVANPAEIAYADVTSFGTTSWVNVNVGSVNGQYITYMFWVDYGHLYAVTNDGYIYKSTNGGVSWTVSLSTAISAFRDISALPDGTIWAVGDSGIVYFSEDHAVSWTVKTDPSGGNDLKTCTVTPDGTVFIGDSAGYMYGTYNDGGSYTTLDAQGVTPTNVVRIRHFQDSDIWAVVDVSGGSSRALRSTDGGANFRLWSLNLPSNSGLLSLFVCDPNLVYVAGEAHGGSAFLTRTNPLVVGF